VIGQFCLLGPFDQALNQLLEQAVPAQDALGSWQSLSTSSMRVSCIDFFGLAIFSFF
jgi:hypothetical protein